jgi:hypothetical protein
VGGKEASGVLRQLPRLSWANQRLLGETLATLAATSFAIRVLPFRQVVQKAKAVGGTPDASPEHARREINRCLWAVERLAALVPWKTMCFQKGLTLHLLLRRRGVGSVLHYGVGQQPEKGLTAHVWISVDGDIIMGGEVVNDYRRLASFPSDEVQAG